MEASTLLLCQCVALTLGLITSACVTTLQGPKAPPLAHIRRAAASVAIGAAQSVCLAAFTAALSPLYLTLTASISDDTIVACTCALLVAHLYLHDYGSAGAAGQSRVTGSLSLACAVCASALMASQMRTLAQVFALVSWPLIRVVCVHGHTSSSCMGTRTARWGSSCVASWQGEYLSESDGARYKAFPCGLNLKTLKI